MTAKNKHGLSRSVPRAVEREIRQRCGFGCVICGLAFYDYEHFAPDFVDATFHNPEGMTLLCSQCNQKRARGRLSAETVAAANANPRCLQQGYANEMFDFGVGGIEVLFAGISFTNCPDLIVVNDYPVLSIAPPEAQGEPFRLSGRFADRHGKTTLLIIENTFRSSVGNWDVEWVGPRLIVRRAAGEIALSLALHPPHRIDIERIDMFFKGVFFRGGAGKLETSFDGASWSTFRGVSLVNARIGMAFDVGLPRAANESFFSYGI